MLKFSVIIPVYNVEDYLVRCLSSVLSQDADDYELILVDDGSTDSSGRICDKYAAENPNIRVIHQENGGLGAARNTGIENASGEYLLFVDSDDYISKVCLEGLRRAREKLPADIYLFDIVDEVDGVESRHRENLPADKILSAQKNPELFLVRPSACNRAIKRELFIQNDVRFPAGVWYEDIRTSPKLSALAKSVVYVPEAFYYYSQRQGSITQNINLERNREIIDAFEDLLGWFKEKDFFDTYKAALEALALEHLFIAASVRVIRINAKSEMPRAFELFFKEHFPGYKTNHYTKSLSKNQKLVLQLLENHLYFLVALIFNLKENIAKFRRP